MGYNIPEDHHGGMPQKPKRVEPVKDADEYQRLAARTRARSDNTDRGLAVLGLGIAGEAGEVADIIKKVVGHGHSLDIEAENKLVKELGDVLWYAASIADVLKVNLSTVMGHNIQKLRERYPDGFSTERSMNRSGE